MFSTAIPQLKTFSREKENQAEDKIEKLRGLIVMENVAQACYNMCISYSETLRWINARLKGGSIFPGTNKPSTDAGAAVRARCGFHN